MPFMTIETKHSNPRDWDALCEHILELAHRRAESLLAAGADEDAFDRGARSLRTLMSSAESATRMKREEAREREPNDQSAGADALTEGDIEETYRRIYGVVERMEREDAAGGPGNGAQGDAADAGASCGSGGAAVAGERP